MANPGNNAAGQAACGIPAGNPQSVPLEKMDVRTFASMTHQQKKAWYFKHLGPVQAPSRAVPSAT